jgi:hypothetical protein
MNDYGLSLMLAIRRAHEEGLTHWASALESELRSELVRN